ncbi:MAG: hypothetical protein WC796_06050 [Candidatus Pacearchaeota archaeon]|jgi:hypothetical protein
MKDFEGNRMFTLKRDNLDGLVTFYSHQIVEGQRVYTFVTGGDVESVQESIDSYPLELKTRIERAIKSNPNNTFVSLVGYCSAPRPIFSFPGKLVKMNPLGNSRNIREVRHCLERAFSEWAAEHVVDLSRELTDQLDNRLDLSYERVVELLGNIDGGVDCPVERKQLPKILDPREDLGARAIFQKIDRLVESGIFVRVNNDVYLLNPNKPIARQSM